MMGSNEQSFIDRYLETTPEMTPYSELRAELAGVEKWHKIIGSSLQPWFNVATLGMKIRALMVAREAKANPWAETVLGRMHNELY